MAGTPGRAGRGRCIRAPHDPGARWWRTLSSEPMMRRAPQPL